MGGRWYQKEAFEIVDYQLYQMPNIDEWFRGPEFQRSTGEYISFIGAAQTFGTFVRYPFPAILAERLPVATVNLGIGGAGPRRFLQDARLLEVANAGKATVVQVMSGRSAENSRYELLNGCSAMRPKGEVGGSWQFAEYVWRQLHTQLSPRDFKILVDETRRDWCEHMQRLLDAITTPKILLWISRRAPAYDDDFRSADGVMNGFPHFVNESMLASIIEHADLFVDATSSRGCPQTLSSRITGTPYTVVRPEISFKYNNHYPSPAMHEDIASGLIEPLRTVMGRGCWITRERRRDDRRRYSALSNRRAIVLLSHERSGSSMLKSMFDASSTVTYTGEVFNWIGNRRIYRYDFSAYCRDKDDWRRLTEPSEENLDSLLESFFDFILDRATTDDKPNVLVDVKYRSTCVLSGGIGGAWRRPSFVGRLRRFDIPVVHLYRRNVFAAACSAELAVRSGLYNDYGYRGIGGVSREKIRIEPEGLFQECVGLSAEIIAWKQWLADLRPVTLTYEELTEDLETRNAAVDRMAKFFIGGHGLSAATPRMRRISGGPATYVSNYAELRNLEKMFSDVHAYRDQLVRDAGLGGTARMSDCGSREEEGCDDGQG